MELTWNSCTYNLELTRLIVCGANILPVWEEWMNKHTSFSLFRRMLLRNISHSPSDSLILSNTYLCPVEIICVLSLLVSLIGSPCLSIQPHWVTLKLLSRALLSRNTKLRYLCMVCSGITVTKTFIWGWLWKDEDEWCSAGLSGAYDISTVWEGR